MSDDDIPDLVEKSTGAVVKASSTTSISSLNACTSPLVEASTKERRVMASNPRLDPATHRDSNGYSELHWAVYMGDVESVKQLLEEKKFDVNDIANEKKQTPLLWAATMGRTEIAYILLEQGAFLDYVDFEGFSAIGQAVQNGHCLLAHLLFEMGADPKTLDGEGHTLLHWAVYRHQYKMVAYLLRHRGSDVNTADANGATALHWAAMRGSEKCVSPLIENGASLTLKDSRGKTALDIAKENKFKKIIAELEADKRPQKMCCGLDYNNQLFWGPLIICPIVYAMLMSLSTIFVALFAFILYYSIKSGLAFKHIQGPGGFRSMFPYGFMCATCVGVYYYNIRYILTMEDQFYLHCLFHLSCAMMFACCYRFKKHVGYIPLDRKLTPQEWSTVRTPLFCPFCAVQTPIRTHHCRRCNRCVGRFDHHCPWVDGCVGYENNHVFIPMVLGGAIGHLIFAFQGFRFLQLQYAAAAGFRVFWNDWSCMTVFWISQFFQLAGEWFLVYTQTRGAMADLTTWEQMGLMQHGERPNPYDRGIETNLKQFFHIAGVRQIDYMTKFDGPLFDFEVQELV